MKPLVVEKLPLTCLIVGVLSDGNMVAFICLTDEYRKQLDQPEGWVELEAPLGGTGKALHLMLLGRDWEPEEVEELLEHMAKAEVGPVGNA